MFLLKSLHAGLSYRLKYSRLLEVFFLAYDSTLCPSSFSSFLTHSLELIHLV